MTQNEKFIANLAVTYGRLWVLALEARDAGRVHAARMHARAARDFFIILRGL